VPPGNDWTEGPLTDLGLVVMDSPNVAFQFCFDNWESQEAKTFGIQAFYGSDPKTIQQVHWTNGTNTWIKQGQFTANGHAGVGCYTWDTANVQYKMFVNLDNEVNVMWKDIDTDIASTATHPINSWTNTTVSIPGVLPITSVSWNKNLVVQMADGPLVFNNITLDAEKTQLNPSLQFRLDNTPNPLPGTHIWLWNLPIDSNDEQLTIFCQLNGSDITYILRDMETGQLKINALSIPD
jgi:hypothetical protein